VSDGGCTRSWQDMITPLMSRRHELPEMAYRNRRLCGSIPAHGGDPSQSQAVGSIPAHRDDPSGCRPWEAYLLPFLCQGRALMAVEAAWASFGIFPPLLRVDLTPKGRARWSHLLGVGRGETHARGVGRGGMPSRGVGRARDLLCWAGLGRSFTHNYFRRAKANVL
jgi:hypothetical protein